MGSKGEGVTNSEGRAPNQSLVEVLPESQVELELVGQKGRVLKSLENNAPKLSDDDIRQIADRVAQQVIEMEVSALPPEEKKAWKQRLKKIGYDIGVNLTGSGIWAGLLYAAAHITLAAGPEETERQARNQRRMAQIRAKLAEGVNEDETDLLVQTDALQQRLAGKRQLAERLLHSEAYQQYRRAVEREEARVGNVYSDGQRRHRRIVLSMRFIEELYEHLFSEAYDRIVPKQE
jgi:hypothetical protein